MFNAWKVSPPDQTVSQQLSFLPLESRVVPHGGMTGSCVGSVSGMVYADCNSNGVFDTGDVPISGSEISIFKIDESNSNILPSLVDTTITGDDGRYSFDHLDAGSYTLVQKQPTGYADGLDYVGTVDGGINGNLNGPNDTISAICMPECGVGVGYDFTEQCPPVSPPPPPPPPMEVTGREGLTPGFWKNNATKHNGSAWGDTGYFMYQTLGSVFNFTGTGYESLANTTLVQALSLNGGGVNALMRHAVAGLLNAGHPEVDYPLTSQQIMAQVNSALDPDTGSAAEIEMLKNELDRYNNLGANLNQKGQAT